MKTIAVITIVAFTAFVLLSIAKTHETIQNTEKAIRTYENASGLKID